MLNAVAAYYWCLNILNTCKPIQCSEFITNVTNVTVHENEIPSPTVRHCPQSPSNSVCPSLYTFSAPTPSRNAGSSLSSPGPLPQP